VQLTLRLTARLSSARQPPGESSRKRNHTAHTQIPVVYVTTWTCAFAVDPPGEDSRSGASYGTAQPSGWGTPRLDTRTRTRTASNQARFHPVLTVVYRSLRTGLDGMKATRTAAAMDNTTTMGQRVGYVRVSSLGQCTDRQLDGVPLDETFTDRCSGRDTNRPALLALLNHVRAGDTMVCHSLDRLARNLTDLRALVTDLTARGVRVEFVTENLVFTGGDSPLQTLLLSMLGSVAEFERALIHERQLEGVALAKAAGRYKGGTPKLSSQRAAQLRERVAAGEPKAALAREFGLTRQTVYNYLAQAEPVPA